MNKRLFPLFLTLVLALTMCLATAVPAMADETGTSTGEGEVAGVVTITSTDIQGPYVETIQKGFSVTTESDSAYEGVRFDFVLADAASTDVSSIQYNDGSGWKDMPLTESGDDLVGYYGPEDGFDITTEELPYSHTTPCRVTFSTTAQSSYEVTIALVKAADMAVIKSADFSITVNDLIASTTTITAPSNFSFGTFTMGADNLASSETDGEVTFTAGNDGATGWQVTAEDQNTATGAGYMLRNSDQHPLDNKLQISGDECVSYASADTGITYTGTETDSFTFDAKQAISTGEYAGTYNITIVFVNSLTF